MNIKASLAVCAAVLGTSSFALAQSTPSAGSNDTVPEKIAPKTDVGESGGTLSDKLGATNGVIHPRGDVDPGISKPAPATGTMPVVPPPGSPGGDPNVQPK